MKELKVKDMLQICNGKLICGNEEEICEHFVKDTNEVTVGDVYVGIKGEKVDGSLIYEKALKIYQELDIWDERAEAVYDAIAELEKGTSEEIGG